MWVNRLGVAMSCLAVFGITMAVVAQGYKNDLRIQQEIFLAHKCTDTISNLSLETDEKLLIKIMELTGGDINKKSEDGSTAMHSAFSPENSTQFIDLLISHGADLNAEKGKGGTPLMMGMHRGAYELVIHVLINHSSKIDLSIENPRGLNLYDMAVSKQKRDLGDPLLEQIIYLTDR